MRAHPLAIAAGLLVVGLAIQPRHAKTEPYQVHPTGPLVFHRVPYDNRAPWEDRDRERVPYQDRQWYAQASQWQIVRPALRTCTPMSESLGGATTPDEALAVIRRQYPEARIDPDRGLWERVIYTSTGPIHLIRSSTWCGTWFSEAGQ